MKNLKMEMDRIASLTEVDNAIVKGLVDEGIIESDEIEKCKYSKYDSDIIEVGSREYLVINELDIEERVKESITEELWAFNPNFLSEATELSVVIFEGLCDSLSYEKSNEAIRELIDITCGMDEVVDLAIEYDGAGHFLSPYDGESMYIQAGNQYFGVFRLN